MASVDVLLSTAISGLRAASVLPGLAISLTRVVMSGVPISSEDLVSVLA